MRNMFDTFLKTNIFEGFGGLHHADQVGCNWQVGWNGRCKSIRETLE